MVWQLEAPALFIQHPTTDMVAAAAAADDDDVTNIPAQEQINHSTTLHECITNSLQWDFIYNTTISSNTKSDTAHFVMLSDKNLKPFISLTI